MQVQRQKQRQQQKQKRNTGVSPLRFASGDDVRVKTAHQSHRLEDSGGAHASSYAHGDHSVAGFAAGHLAQEGGGEFGSGAAEGVAEGDGSAVDVEAGGVEAEDLDDGEGLGGEGFVELDEVDLVEGEAGEFEHFGDGVDGADAHLLGVAAGVGEGDEAGQRRGCRGRRRGLRDMTTAAAAPSEVWEELPAVTVPLAWKTGLSLARASREVSARGPSSCLKMVSVV